MSHQEQVQPEKGDVLFEGGRAGVLLVHGLGGTPVEVRFVAQALSRQGYTVFCPLLKGHGGSDLLLNTTTWQEWLGSAERGFEILKQRCDTVLVAGQSAGAMLAIHVAAKHQDEIAGTVFYSPTFWPNGWAIPAHFRAFRIIRQRWLANLFNFHERAPYGLKDDRIRSFVLESLQKDGRALDDIFGRRGGTVFEFGRLARSAKKNISKLTKPALVFHSREDDQAHISNAWQAVSRMKGHVDMVVLDDSYHLVTLDRQRGLVVDRTVEFADRAVKAHQAKANKARGKSNRSSARPVKQAAD